MLTNEKLKQAAKVSPFNEVRFAMNKIHVRRTAFWSENSECRIFPRNTMCNCQLGF